jgi:protein-tyrosine phosphatase
VIDLHCHILYDIDDGPSAIEGSLAMCRMAADDGIKVIVATPHFKPGLFTLPTNEEVIERAALLREKITEEGLDLRVLVGAEVRLTHDTLDYLEREEYLTLNQNRQYFLAEFPMGGLPEGWEELLGSLIRGGYRPLIAHPERNIAFLKNPYKLVRAVRNGAMLQLTAESVTGKAGAEAQDFSNFLLAEGLVHAIATDSHSVKLRPTRLSEAVIAASEIVGEDKAIDLVTIIPEAIIKGDELPVPE